MANQLAKLTTPQLQARLLTAAGEVKAQIEEIISKRNAKVNGKAKPEPVAEPAPAKKKKAAAETEPADDLIGEVPAKSKKEPKAAKKEKLKKAKIGSLVTFESRNGKQKIEGEVIRIAIGKKDGKTYVAVKFKNKLYYKQESALLSVEPPVKA